MVETIGSLFFSVLQGRASGQPPKLEEPQLKEPELKEEIPLEKELGKQEAPEIQAPKTEEGKTPPKVYVLDDEDFVLLQKGKLGKYGEGDKIPKADYEKLIREYKRDFTIKQAIKKSSSAPPFKPFNQMTEAEVRAFNHAISRHGHEFGLKWGKRSTLPKLVDDFNAAVSNIKTNGVFIGVEKVQYGIKGSGESSKRVPANVYNHVINGKTYYYWETTSGQFISAGLKTR